MKRKSVFSKIFALLLVLSVVMASLPCVGAAENVSDDGFKYSITEGKAVVTGYLGDAKEIAVPEKIEEADVVGIGDLAFADCEFIEQVTLPATIEYVGREAFFGTAFERDADNWQDGVLYIGQVLVMTEREKLGTEYTVKAGTTVLASQSFIFCNKLEKVTLPEGVKTIGVDAFKGCESLASITLPSSVKEIKSGAFEECAVLKDVYYTGTQSEWESIVIGDYNDIIDGMTIHFDYTEETDEAPTESAEEKKDADVSGSAHEGAGWVKYCVIAVVFAAAYLVVFRVRSKKVKTQNDEDTDSPDNEE